MPLTRIKNKGLGDSVSRVNIVDTGTEGTKVAAGTTAQRGSTTGQWRYNTTTGFFEGRNTSGTFSTLEPTPTVSSVDISEVDSQAGGNQTVVITGTNFTSGSTASFVGTSATFNASTTTVDSTTQITAVVPKASFLNAQEPYKVRVSSSSGLAGTSATGLINVDSAPTWTTSAGSLGSIAEDATGNHFTVAATDADSDTIAYSLQSGSLAGLSLNSTTGVISGDPTDVSSDTTNSFTLRATAGSKNADRAFSYITTNNPLAGLTEVYNSETQSGNITTHITSHGNIYNETASSSNTNSTWAGTKVARLNDGGGPGDWSNITNNIATSGGVTIALWCKLVTTNNNNPRLFDMYNGAGDYYNQYTGNVEYEMNYRNSGGTVNMRTLTGNSSWSSTNWHFICWRFSIGRSETSQVIKMTVDDYSNNTLHTHTPSSASAGSNSMKSGFMGYDPDSGASSYSFEGNTGGWRVFNDELTDAQITYLYNSGAGRF
tara:strand:- start:47 stop:1510 length:1464 start_codon:yes stop_codon:yes gene_type:complete